MFSPISWIRKLFNGGERIPYVALCIEQLEDRVTPAMLQFQGADPDWRHQSNWLDMSQSAPGSPIYAVPTSGDSLAFNSASTLSIVHLDIDNATPLSFESVVIEDGFTVNFLSSVTVADLYFSGGVIGGSGSLTITSELDWTAGVMRDTGSTILATTASAEILHSTNDIALADMRILVNRGEMNWSGSFAIAPTALLENRGHLALSIFEMVVNSDTQLDNFATIEFKSGNYRFVGSVTIDNTILVGTSDFQPILTIDGQLTTQNFRLITGTITGPGTHIVSNTFDWEAGDLGGPGTTIVPSGGLFKLSGPIAHHAIHERMIIVEGNRETTAVYGIVGITNETSNNLHGYFDNKGILPPISAGVVPFNAALVAGELYQAMYGGVFGGTFVTNTDESAIFRILEAHSSTELLSVATAYTNRYSPPDSVSGQRVLSADLQSELSEVPDQVTRALALLFGDRPRADAAALHYALNPDVFYFYNYDFDLLFRILGRNNSNTIGSVETAWGTMYAGQGTLRAQIEMKLVDPERARALAFLDYGVTDPQRAQALAFVDAGTLHGLIGGPNAAERIAEFLRTHADRIWPILDEYRLRYPDLSASAPPNENAYAYFMRTLAQAGWSQAQRDVFQFAFESKKFEMLAAKLYQAMNGLGTDKQLVWNTLTGLFADERAMVAQVYRVQYGTFLRDAIAGDFSNTYLLNHDLDKTLALLEHGGLTVAQQLYYAMDGLGTDIAAVRAALERMRTMSAAEIAAVDEEYQSLAGETLSAAFGEGSFSYFTGDLSARDLIEARQILLGPPADLLEEISRLLALVDFDRHNGTGLTAGDVSNILSGTLLARFNSHGANLDASRARLVQLRAQLENNEATEAQVRAQLAVVRQDLGLYTSVRDDATEYFANALTTAATVGVVIFTGGTATPLLVAAVGAAANTMGHLAFAGASYDLGSMPVDAVNGALAGLTANVSFFGSSEAASMLGYIMRGAAQGAVDGAATGFVLGAVDAAMRSPTWEQGWQVGIVQITQAGVISGMIGGVTGGAIGAVHRVLYCFPAGTPVSTENGLAPIESLTEGQRVWTFNFRHGDWELQPVLHRFEHAYHGDMITLRIGSETLESTGNHPFWVLSGNDLASRPHPEHIPADEPGNTSLPGRWVDARDLHIGDVVKRKDAEPCRIEAKSSRIEQRAVYNLHVAENPNFLVGENQVLVHNRLPRDREGIGHWVSGEPGNGVYRSTHPDVLAAVAPGQTHVDITYANNHPDFAPFRQNIGTTLGEVSIQLDIDATVGRTTRHGRDIRAADEAMASLLNSGGTNPATGQPWTRTDVEAYRAANQLTWHHHESLTNGNTGRMQLVKFELNDKLAHRGGRAICDYLFNLSS